MKRSSQQAADMPFKPDAPTHTFKSILSTNDFHRASGKQKRRPNSSQPNSDLVSSTGSGQLVKLSDAAKNYFDGSLEEMQQQKRQHRPVSVRNSRDISNLRPLARAIASSQRESSRNSQDSCKRNVDLSASALRNNINRFKRKVKGKLQQQKRQKPPVKEAARRYRPQQLRYKANDFKMAAEVIRRAQHLMQSRQSATSSYGSIEQLPKRLAQLSATSSRVNLEDREDQIMKQTESVASPAYGPNVRMSQAQKQRQTEFSFRPNTPTRTNGNPCCEEITRSCNSLIEQLGDQHRSTALISLIDRLAKSVNKGLSWTEALQIEMIKTHMQAKALLFYQKKTRRKFMHRMISAYLIAYTADHVQIEAAYDLPTPRGNQRSDTRNEVFPTFGKQTLMQSLQSTNAENVHPNVQTRGRDAEKQFLSPKEFKPLNSRSSQQKQSVKSPVNRIVCRDTSETVLVSLIPKSLQQESDASLLTGATDPEMGQGFKQIPQTIKLPQPASRTVDVILQQRRSISTLMKTMDICKKTEILKRQQRINKVQEDKHLKIRKGISMLEELADTHQSQISLEFAFAQWAFRLADEQLLSAAQDFRTQVLLSKALQSFATNIEALRSNRSAVRKLRIKKNARLAHKVIFVLRVKAEKRNQRRLRRELAEKYYASKLMQIAVKSWRTFARANARIKEVDHKAKNVAELFIKVARSAQLNEQTPTRDSFEPNQNLPFAKLNMLRRCFGFLRKQYLAVRDFKASQVEAILKNCLKNWRSQAMQTNLVLSNLDKKCSSRRQGVAFTAWRARSQSNKYNRQVVILCQRQFMRQVLRKMMLNAQRSKQKRDTIKQADIYQHRKLLRRVVLALSLLRTQSQCQEQRACLLLTMLNNTVKAKAFNALVRFTSMRKRERRFARNPLRNHKCMKSFFVQWVAAQSQSRRVTKFRHDQLLLRSFKAFNQGVYKAKADRFIISTVRETSSNKLKTRIIAHLKWKTWLQAAAMQLAIQSLKQSRRHKLTLCLHALSAHASKHSQLRQLESQLNKKTNQGLKRRILRLLREQTDQTRLLQIRHWSKLRWQKAKLLNALKFQCSNQRSLRDRLIDFGSNRLKRRCCKLFNNWHTKALSLHRIRQSLIQRQNQFICKRVLKRLHLHSARSQNARQLQTLFTARRDELLKIKAIKAMKANCESEATNLKRKASKHHALSLLGKTMHVFVREADKRREHHQIMCERDEKWKAKYLTLWRTALANKCKQRKVQQVVQLTRKKNVLMRLRLNAQAQQEKRLKYHAAQAFRLIWLKQTVLNSIVVHAQSCEEKNQLHEKLLALRLHKRNQTILDAWKNQSKQSRRQRAFCHLLRLAANRRLMHACFQRMIRLSLNRKRTCVLVQQKSVRLRQLAFKALQMHCAASLNRNKKAQAIIEITMSQRLAVVFQSLKATLSSKSQLRKLNAQCELQRANRLITKCFTSMFQLHQQKLRLRVAMKRVVIRLTKNTKRRILNQMVNKFEQISRRRRLTQMYDEDDDYQRSPAYRTSMPANMFKSLSVYNPIKLASIPGGPVPESRLFQTPQETRNVAGNRLLDRLSQQQKVQMFTMRIQQRLETRSNRSCSTKLRSRSVSQEPTCVQANTNVHDTVLTRPPLQPRLLKMFPESSLSPKISRAPNLRYSGNSAKHARSEVQGNRSPSEFSI